MNTLQKKSTIQFTTIIFIIACFPYISLVKTGFDTQPWTLLISALFFVMAILTKKILMPNTLFILLIIALYATFIYAIHSDTTTGLRSLVGYYSLFLITFAAYHTVGKLKPIHFKFIVGIWFFVGLYQKFINKFFLSFLLSRLSTTDARGVTSLAAEPSYFAIVCLFFIIINDFLYAKEKITKKSYMIILIVLLIQIVISYSGLGFVFVMIYFGARFVSLLASRGIFKSIPKLIVLVAIPIIVLFLFNSLDSLKYSRAGALLSLFKADPVQLLYIDASTSERASDTILSIYGGIVFKPLGNGLGMWNETVGEIQSKIWGWAARISDTRMFTQDRIMSGWGTAIFELGLPGLLILFAFFRTCFIGVKTNKPLKSVFICSGITIFFLMLMSVPLAFPLFSYTLGMMMYYAYKEPFEVKQ